MEMVVERQKREDARWKPSELVLVPFQKSGEGAEAWGVPFTFFGVGAWAERLGEGNGGGVGGVPGLRYGGVKKAWFARPNIDSEKRENERKEKEGKWVRVGHY